MKKLELKQMEEIQGGDPRTAFACGFGVGMALFGWGVLGPFALSGLTLCMNSDTFTRNNVELETIKPIEKQNNSSVRIATPHGLLRTQAG